MSKFDSESSIYKKILVGWLVFGTLYLVWGEYNHLKGIIARQAYGRGVTAVATKLIDQSAACQPIPINIGQNKTAFISVDCLNKDAAAEGADATAEGTDSVDASE